jgi:hypothetical protein
MFGKTGYARNTLFFQGLSHYVTVRKYKKDETIAIIVVCLSDENVV